MTVHHNVIGVVQEYSALSLLSITYSTLSHYPIAMYVSSGDAFRNRE